MTLAALPSYSQATTNHNPCYHLTFTRHNTCYNPRFRFRSCPFAQSTLVILRIKHITIPQHVTRSRPIPSSRCTPKIIEDDSYNTGLQYAYHSGVCKTAKGGVIFFVAERNRPQAERGRARFFKRTSKTAGSLRVSFIYKISAIIVHIAISLSCA